MDRMFEELKSNRHIGGNSRTSLEHHLVQFPNIFVELQDDVSQLEKARRDDTKLTNNLKKKIIKGMSFAEEDQYLSGWQICVLDVAGYNLDELKVTLSGYLLKIEGNHITESEDFYRRMEFRRTVSLCENVVLNSIKITLSPEGILVIKAEKRPLEAEEQTPMEIPVTFV